MTSAATLPATPAPTTMASNLSSDMRYAPFPLRLQREMWLKGELAAQLANQGRDDFVDIAHQTVVGIIEDWRIFIFIDGDNHFCAVAANHMLDLPGDPQRQVEIGFQQHAGRALLVALPHWSWREPGWMSW